MRLHPMTRGAVNNIILRHKPSKDKPQEIPEESTEITEGELPEDEFEYLYYYGIVMMKDTVVTVFKNNPDIAVTPADINCLINFNNNNTFKEH